MDEMVLLWLTLFVSLLMNLLLLYWWWRCGLSIQDYLLSIKSAAKHTAHQATLTTANVEHLAEYLQKRNGYEDVQSEQRLMAMLAYHKHMVRIAQQATEPMPVIIVDTVKMPALLSAGASQQLILPTTTETLKPRYGPLALPSRRPL